VKPLRILLLYALEGGSTLSYQSGWPPRLARDPRFAAFAVNLLDRRQVAFALARLRVGSRRLDAVVLLHSVYSNTLALGGRLHALVAGLPQPKTLFMGNEYKLMPEKVRFAEELGVALLVSQSSEPDVHAAYRERLGCAVVGIPNTGLDPELFAPRTPRRERPIDIGYRAFDGPEYLGHRERRELADVFAEAAPRLGLRVDLSLDASERFTEPEWAAFLDRCRGQLGYEAGGDRFELTDATRHAVIAFLRENPAAPHEEVRARFFDGAPPAPSGRTLSGRVVEAAGTKTVQILLEGRYGGYFEPDVHYIPLRKDYANVDEAVAKLRDEPASARLADAAYEVAATSLTWERLIGRLHDALRPLV
jgi:hypothetical protein